MELEKIGPETETIEYKKSTGEMKEAIISIASILNKHKKGVLYFGVKNDDTVVGQEITDESLRKVSQAIGNHVIPAIYPEIKVVAIGDRECIRVEFEQQPYGFVVIFYRQDKYNMGKNTHVNTYVDTYDEKQNKILGYCLEAKSKREIAEYLGYKTVKSITAIIKPLIEDGVLGMTIPDKPKSINQKYITKL